MRSTELRAGGMQPGPAWGLWRLTWAEWRAHPWRQLAALLSVAMGVALALSVHLINESALAEFASAVRSANGEPDLRLAAGPGGMDEAVLDLLAAQPGVRLAHPRIELDTLWLRPGGATLSVRVIGVDALTVMGVAPELLPRATECLQGGQGTRERPVVPCAGADRLAMLDPALAFVNPALTRELAGATQLALLAQGQPQAWSVGGRVATAGAPLVVMDIAAAQAAFGLGGRITGIDVRLAPGASADAVCLALRASLPAGLRWVAADDEGQRVSNLSRAYRVNLTVLALVALVVGGFLVFSVVSLEVAQRTPALALLGVLGLSAAGRRRMVLGECAVMGLLAGLLGVVLGTGLAALALRLLAGDLGGGFFAGVAPPLRFSWQAAFLCAALGVVAAVMGGAWPAARAARLAPAQALKGLGGQDADAPAVWPGLLLLVAGAGLALMPPIAGLSLAAYASVGAWLVGGISLLPAVVRMLLGRRGARTAHHPLWLLALQRARHFRSTATAAVAGVVASLALCVALTVMVASFRVAVTAWLQTVLPADVYVRIGSGGRAAAQAVFPADVESRVRSVQGVTRVSGTRALPLELAPEQSAVLLLARALGPRPEQALPLVSAPLPLPAGEVGVFVSEAVVALYGTAPGQPMVLPVQTLSAPGLKVYVRGVWRDYARQSGSIAIARADYERLTGDTRLNDLALWLAPGAAPATVEATVRSEVQRAGGTGQALQFASTAQVKAISLQIFDRSFAVTRYLQGVAIAIGLAGVAASLSAQVLARRREFGLLAHLGLTRAQVLRLVMMETTGWLLAGLVVGLALGLAISAVLVYVVNPQSFHWSMDLRIPWGSVAALLGAVLAAGLGTSALAARRALSEDAVRAVKEDW